MLTWILCLLLLLAPVAAQTFDQDKAEADKALSARDFKTAISSFQALVEKYPDRVEAYNALGFALYLDGQFDESISTFEQALQKSPGDDAAQRNLILAGGRRALESSYRDGLARINKLQQRFPGHPQLAVLDFYTGKLHYLYGFADPAFEAWQKVSRARPDSGTALFMKAVDARNRGDAQGQNKLFSEALKKMPTEEVFRLWGARHMIEANEAENAAVLVTPLSERQTLTPGVAIALSRFDRMRGRSLQAYDYLKRTADVPEVLLEKALMTQQLGASPESYKEEVQKALDAGGEGAIIILSDEPGAKVYLDGTLLGSPPLGLFPSPGTHELRLRFEPAPILFSRFQLPAEGMILFQAGSQTGLDLRELASRAELLP